MTTRYNIYVYEIQRGLSFSTREEALKMKEEFEKDGYHVNMYTTLWGTQI